MRSCILDNFAEQGDLRIGAPRDGVDHPCSVGIEQSRDVGRSLRPGTWQAERDPTDYDFETGWSVARAWQAQNRPLRVGERLVPRTPFVLGGAYEADNVVAVPAGNAIEPIVSLCEQLRDLPDGGQVQLRGWNAEGWASE